MTAEEPYIVTGMEVWWGGSTLVSLFDVNSLGVGHLAVEVLLEGLHTSGVVNQDFWRGSFGWFYDHFITGVERIIGKEGCYKVKL